MDAIHSYLSMLGTKPAAAAQNTARAQNSAAQQQPGAAAPAPTTGATATAGATPATAEKPIKQDTLTLSAEERKRALAEAFEKKLREKDDAAKRMLEEVKQAKEQSKAMEETIQKQNKCFLIAMRIMAGDKVPPGDYRYLAKNSPGLYSQALTLRVARENPRKYKQLSREEENNRPDRTHLAGDGKGPGDGGAPGAPESTPTTPGTPATPESGAGGETSGGGAGAGSDGAGGEA